MSTGNRYKLSAELVRHALNLEGFNSEQAQKLMMPVPRGVRLPDMPGQPRLGGVLVVLFQKDDQTQLVLTRRRDDLNAHAGQISFPGGRKEGDEPLRTTALREAEEEIGINSEQLEVLGELSPLYIPPTDYEVHPFVAWYTGNLNFKRQVTEVAEIILVPLKDLLEPANQFEEPWEIRGYQVQVPFYLVDGHKVWGATAMMLSEFLERLRRIRSETDIHP